MMMLDAIDNNQSNGSHRTLHPLSGDTAFLPIYSPAFTNPDSDLTYTLPVSRKRSRSDAPDVYRSFMDHGASFTFLGEDISSQIRQQEIEIDQFVARHEEKLRVEIEAKRRRNSRKLISVIDERITHMLKAKEEEIMKMAKLNCALEERVKSLCIENQIWRELAETNEATANALRSNLKQVLEQLVDSNFQHRTTNDPSLALADDAESCCESNNDHMLPQQYNCGNSISNSNRMCKSCWKSESCVLLLPCRHLCLCTVCASSVHICPICKSSKNISVHVHMP